jgi:hypothetical protein
MLFSPLLLSVFFFLSSVSITYFVLLWEYFFFSLCVRCFLAKRNKSDKEENDKVKNKIGRRGRLRMLHGLETHGGLTQESCGSVL